VREAVDGEGGGGPRVRVEEIRRLSRAIFDLGEPAPGVFPALEKVQSAYAEGRIELSGASRSARCECVALLATALRHAALSAREEEQVLAWLREAVAGDGASERIRAAEAERQRLLDAISGYRELADAVAVFNDAGSVERALAAHGGEAPAAAEQPAEEAPAVAEAARGVAAEEGSCGEGAAKEEAGSAELLPQRLARLRRRLASPAVQVPEPGELEEVPARLGAEEVAKVFKDHVPGVERLIYRQQPGNYSLGFIQSAYAEGLRAFSGSDMHEHLMWLMRLIVHHGHEGQPGAARHLREVAEAFTDCQAVQGRTIERVGLQIRGVSLDFRGHLVRLAGEYKAMAAKILAVEECTRLGGPDDYNDPAHYENRIIADAGEELGLNRSHIKQALLDSHAHERFRRLVKGKRRAAVGRLRELFDVEAWLKAFAAEASTLGAESERESLPRLFLDWAAERMTDQHVVLDEDTCSRLEVGEALALAVAEAVFLGKPGCSASEEYRGARLAGLFVADEGLAEEVAKAAEAEAAAAMEAEKEQGNDVCQAEDNSASEEEDSDAMGNEPAPAWEVDLGSHWARFDRDAERTIAKAEAAGQTKVELVSRGWMYIIDLDDLVQINVQTCKSRTIRRADQI